MGSFVTASPHAPLPTNKTNVPGHPPGGLSYEVDAEDLNGPAGAANDLYVHAALWVNVKSYGAKGDDAADDTAACVAAEAAAYAAGMPLHFPPGTYRLSATFTPRISVFGSGRSVTTLKILHANATADGVVFSSADGLVISGITLLGTVLTVRDLLSLQNCQRMELLSVTTNVCGRYGLRVLQGLDSTYEKCRFDNSTSAGIYIEPAVGNVVTTQKFHRCYATNTTAGPGADVAGNQINFHDCIFESNGSVTAASGVGLRARSGAINAIGCYWENNAWWDVDAGTDSASTCNLTIVNPIVVGGSYKDTSHYGFHYDYVKGGATIGGQLTQSYSTSITMTSHTENHAIIAPTLNGVDPTWDLGGGRNLGDYNGFVSVRDSNTAMQKSVGLGFLASLMVATKNITHADTPYALDGLTGQLTVDATAGVVTVTLPLAGNYAGRIYTVVKTDSSANGVTVSAAGGNTIDGVSSFFLNQQHSGVTLICQGGTSWHAVGAEPVSLTAVGSSPNDNGASLNDQTLTLQPASATKPGVVTAGTQTLAGVKTFSSDTNHSGDVYVGGVFRGFNGALCHFAADVDDASGAVTAHVHDTGTHTFARRASKLDSWVNHTTEYRNVDAFGKFNVPANGADSCAGTSAAMTAGAIVISTTAVTASSIIRLTHAGSAVTNAGHLYPSNLVAGTSFKINSTNGADTDTVHWEIVN